MQPMPAMMNDRTMAGRACWAAASPVSTKMPVPMMPPMPIAVSATGPSDLRSSPFSPSAARSWTDFTASRFFSMVLVAPRLTLRGAALRGTLAQIEFRSIPQARRHVRRQQLQQRRIDLGRADDDVAVLLVFAAVQPADHAAGFGDQQGSRLG